MGLIIEDDYFYETIELKQRRRKRDTSHDKKEGSSGDGSGFSPSDVPDTKEYIEPSSTMTSVFVDFITISNKPDNEHDSPGYGKGQKIHAEKSSVYKIDKKTASENGEGVQGSINLSDQQVNSAINIVTILSLLGVGIIIALVAYVAYKRRRMRSYKIKNKSKVKESTKLIESNETDELV